MEVLAIEGLVKFKAVMEPLQEFSNVRLCAIVPAFVDRRVKKSEDQLAEIRRLLEASPITLEVQTIVRTTIAIAALRKNILQRLLTA
jgi:hypothetical protein